MSKKQKGLRLMVYDDSENRPVGWTWKIGSIFFWIFGRFDAVKGVKSWDEAIRWTLEVSSNRKIDDWRFWGHGTPGRVYVNGIALSTLAIESNEHSMKNLLEVLKTRFTSTSLIWFRTCSTAAGVVGKDFMEKFSTFFNCTVAAQTYVVHWWHSGVHTLRPGQKPAWPDSEGKLETIEDGTGKSWSRRDAPNTLLFLQGNIPSGW